MSDPNEPHFSEDFMAQWRDPPKAIPVTSTRNQNQINGHEPSVKQDELNKDSSDHVYENSEEGMFKTINRIIDDVKALLFLNDKQFRGTILKSRPIEYSNIIHENIHNPYKVFVLSESNFSTKVDKRKSFDNPNDKVITLRGLILNTNPPQLSKMEVHHLKLLIKTKASHNHVNHTKNEFHLIDDKDLSDDDRKDLILSDILDESDPSYSTAKNCLPDLDDYATFVCSKTQKILRIEISKPEFSFEDLNDFEMGPIGVRYKHASAKYPTLNPDKVPSPSECLHTLFKTLRGPLLQDPTSDTQSIDVNNKTLNAKLNTQLLLKKLYFRVQANKYVPVNFSHYETEPNSLIIKESFIRKLNETVLLGTKAYSAGKPNPFNDFRFTEDLSTIFEALQDNASVLHHKGLLQEVEYINLSAFPFYSDDFIINCYTKTVKTDEKNISTYFDNIREIARKKSSKNLSNFVSVQIASGLIGKKDLDAAYKILSVDPNDAVSVDDLSLITVYQTESAIHAVNTTYRNALKLIGKARSSSKIHKFLSYELLPIEKAHEVFGVAYPEFDDYDFLPNLYALRKGESNDEEKELLDRAYITIATESKNVPLLNIIDAEFPDINEPVDYSTACQELGVDKNLAEDVQIIEIFKNATIANHIEIKKARNALRVIGDYKESKLISDFLATGSLNNSLVPVFSWPVGLRNIGNTCYLNSILQYLFAIKPIRDFVLNFNDTLDDPVVYTKRGKLGGSTISPYQVERAFQFTYRLKELFYELIHTNQRVISPTRELAFLVFVRFEDTVDFIREPVAQPDDQRDDRSSNDSDIQIIKESKLQDIDSDIEIIEKPTEDVVIVQPESVVDYYSSEEDFDGDFPVPDDDDANENNTLAPGADVELLTGPHLLEISAKQMNELDPNTQQDAQECLSNVLLQLEAVLPPDVIDNEDGEQVDFIKRLFFGKTLQRLVDINDQNDISSKKERFANLLVNVEKKPRTLYDGLDSLFATERVDMTDGQRDKYERIIEIPTILQIQFQRTYYDRDLQSVGKLLHGVECPKTLYMDRYLDTDDADIIRKREEITRLNDELLGYNERLDTLQKLDAHGLTVRESLIGTRDWLKSLEAGSSELIASLEMKINSIPEEIETINKKIEELKDKIDHYFDEYNNHTYSLFAVFMHKGDGTHGHYWIYIKDSHEGYFRKYNDETVSEVQDSVVLNVTANEDATAFLLGYVREGHEEDIEALFRVQLEEDKFSDLEVQVDLNNSGFADGEGMDELKPIL